MIVTRRAFDSVLAELCLEPELALDTETSGLRMYHGDRLFSVIIAHEKTSFYFNFNPFSFAHIEGTETKHPLPDEYVLLQSHLDQLLILFNDPNKLWFIQNAANFDLGVLGVEGLDLKGTVHCTKAIGRVEYNEHFGKSPYSLDSQLERLGLKKDDRVKEYVKKNKLHTDVPLPGKNEKYRVLHYDRVPFDVIVPYGERDGTGTFLLGRSQVLSIFKQDFGQYHLPPSRSLSRVMDNERRLQKTIYRMRHRGVLVDLPYCQRASSYELDRGLRAQEIFKRETGTEYKASSKLFKQVFESEKAKWVYTEKGNPSFESAVLEKFEHPAARAILDIRDAKSKSDFYNGFLWFADASHVVHPNFNPDGAAHGRFSSSEPNFQNLTSEESVEEISGEFIVRRALIPRQGFTFLSIDYNALEFRFMLEQACELIGRTSKLSDLIKTGLDVHEATAKNAIEFGVNITRKEAKMSNFLTLYGGGSHKLADALSCSVEQARSIRNAIFKSSPEIKQLIDSVMSTAETRGFIINWLGRRCYFPNKKFSYRAPNYLISGGTADIVKIAMNSIDDYLLNKKSKLVMTIHDELVFEIHESEISTVPDVLKNIMETTYVSKYVSLPTAQCTSTKSLGDMQ